MRRLQRGDPRQPRVDHATPCRALGAPAPLAPEAPRPNRALGGVVRGRPPGVPNEGPQGPPPRAPLPAPARRVGHPTRRACVQPPLHGLPHRPPSAGHGPMGPRAVADARPPGAHRPGWRLHGCPQRTGAPPTCAHGVAVAPQRRPAHRPSPRRIPGVGAPAIRHPPPPAALPQACSRDVTTTRHADPPHGDARRDRRPPPRPLPAFAPPGLVHSGGRRGGGGRFDTGRTDQAVHLRRGHDGMPGRDLGHLMPRGLGGFPHRRELKRLNNGD